MTYIIDRLDDYGRGITYVNDKICFVENALPKEEVEINILKENKKIIEAEQINLLSTSSERETNICPFYKECGGCNTMHMSYQLENTFKDNKVKNLVSKFTKLDKDIVRKIVTSTPINYRNKIVLHGKNKKLGLYSKKTNSIVEIDKCILVNNKINEIINILKAINNGIEEVTIRTSNDEEEVLVNIKGKVKDIELLKNKVDVLIINNKTISIKESIITNINNYKFYLSSNSFFQVNKYITPLMFNTVENIVKEIKPNKVLDLYCGTGTFGIYISKYSKEVIGIDYNKSNINDANNNKKLNNIENIKFICDKVENKIDEFNNIDLIIIDPPRAGLDNKTKEYLNIIKPKNIIYISCDPVTLVRDLNDLNINYDIEYILPFNNFPKTYHVECVSVLSRKTQ